jgi:hypothetical protein
MFIVVLQNDPNWHTLDRLPVPYAIDRKKLANIGGYAPARHAVLEESRGCWRAG